MAINIIIFGQLADITGGNIAVDNVADTDSLLKELTHQFPQLANTKFVVAVDKQIIKANTLLNNNNSVALLPPFSGG